MSPCAGCAMYGISKHGLVGLATSIVNEAAQGGLNVTVSSVLPGLVNTPFTWNQVRGQVIINGELKPAPFLKEPLQVWQCIASNGTVITNGNCENGGTGYGCPCPDIPLSDPRVALMETTMQPDTNIIDPNAVAAEVLDLLDGYIGEVRVVPNDPKNDHLIPEGPLTRKCPLNMWESCPITKSSDEDE